MKKKKKKFLTPGWSFPIMVIIAIAVFSSPLLLCTIILMETCGKAILASEIFPNFGFCRSSSFQENRNVEA